MIHIVHMYLLAISFKSVLIIMLQAIQAFDSVKKGHSST